MQPTEQTEHAEPQPRAIVLLPRHTDLPLLAKRPLTFAHRYRWPLLLLLLGAVADAVTTYINLSWRQFNASVEVHPVQRMVFEVFGAALGVPLAKLIQLAFVLFVAAWWRPWCGWVLSVCGTLYLLAAISNYFMLI